MADENDQDVTSQGEGTNDTGDAGTDAQGASQTSETGADTPSNDVVPREELEKVKNRMSAADKRADAAEKKLEELERKERTELENVQSDLKKAQDTIADLTEKLRTQALENAFFTDNKHTWHDPRDALRLMDMEGVEITDDFQVKGLGAAVEKLAKSKPHLLKSESDGKGGDDSSSSGASGNANNGKRKGEGKNPPNDMSSRFPALKR